MFHLLIYEIFVGFKIIVFGNTIFTVELNLEVIQKQDILGRYFFKLYLGLFSSSQYNLFANLDQNV